MKILFRVSILLVCMFSVRESQGQSGGVVRDSITHEPVPFVNIWIEGETTGTTSNEQGVYLFKKSLIGKRLVFSSIGYKRKTHTITDTQGYIVLQPDVVHLKEIAIRATRNGNSKSFTAGERYRISEVKRFFFCGESPYIAAKYFPYQDSYTKTPFVSALEIVTSSPRDSSSFNIRLYEMDENGEPGKPVYGENIIGFAKKGVTLTRVDLMDKNIEFPRAGLLVAFEFLIIERNKHTYIHTNHPDTVKQRTVVYTPAVGTVPIATEGTSWIYNAGSWRTTTINKRVQQEEYEGKYSDVAMRLTLVD
jgi:hypothetical protein